MYNFTAAGMALLPMGLGSGNPICVKWLTCIMYKTVLDVDFDPITDPVNSLNHQQSNYHL